MCGVLRMGIEIIKLNDWELIKNFKIIWKHTLKSLGAILKKESE